ncbi:Flp pilus assembly complex ATPase component TadA [archaeon]|nr:Flp pilus assembly complex ATPase component TadA [archaeon]
MSEQDCSKLTEEVRKLESELGEKYEGVFISDPDKIASIAGEIKTQTGASDEAIKCYIYKNLSIGNLTPFLLDGNLEEIMEIGGGEPVYVYDKNTGMTESDTTLETKEIKDIIRKIARYSGRTVDGSNPLLDGRLPDGSRANATFPEVTPRGPTLTIRKFEKESLSISDLIRFGTMTPTLAAFLWLTVEGLGTKPANVLVLGGTACGKTTTINALSHFIPAGERIISIEDTLEVNLRHKHWIPMETKPSDPGKDNEIEMDDLLKNALRMRPDRIIVGEVRSKEALSLFTAMNTGHDGCMATIHANSAKEALTRLQTHPMNVPDVMIPALDLIIAQNRRVEEGKIVRRIVEVAEIGGREGGTILTNTLFKFDPEKKKLEINLLNGRIIQELSTLTNLTVKEIDAELDKREAILDTMAKNRADRDTLHEVVNLYYKNPDEAIELLYERVKG